MFKAVVSNLDGTLLNAEHKVSEFTRETVELLLKKGIKFYIATGRNYLGAKEAMDELGVKVPLITSHGSVAFDENGNEIFQITWSENIWIKSWTLITSRLGKI